MAVRYYKRATDVGDIDITALSKIMAEADTNPDEAEEIYALTALPTAYQRYAIPPIHREEAISGTCSPEMCKGCAGFGTMRAPERGP